MELIEKKGAKEEWKMPRNIRQIGEPGERLHILIEDYAYTYLHQLAESNLTCMKTAILIGRQEKESLYIQAAMELEMGQEMEKWFSNENWRDIFQNVQSWFDGLDVVGWFLSNPGFPPVMTDSLSVIHARNFSGGRYVFFQLDILEKEEVFFRRDSQGVAPLPGFYIYYEKNERMQAYISSRKGGAGIEPEGILKDRTTAKFRSVMQEKKEHSSQKKTVVFLYASSVMLAMVILVIGITMVNNYDRITYVETALHRLSENLEEASEKESSEISAEELQEAVLEENQQPAAGDAEAAGPEDAGAEEAQPEAAAADEEPTEAVMSEAVQEPEKYIVQKGDTLLGICRVRYGTDEMLRTVCELNGLGDGNKIFVGQTILLP